MTERTLKVTDLNEPARSSAWAAYRHNNVTWIDDEHGHIAAVVHPLDAKPERVLTIEHASLIADILRGVHSGSKLSYYPKGADSADHPATYVMRAFTHEGGGIYFNGDIRDSYVWCSGFTEHWFKVSDLIMALDNNDGKHGLESPIATIESR